MSLLSCGRSASLQLESKSGQAFVTLKLDLGYPHPPPPGPPVTPPSPVPSPPPQHHHEYSPVVRNARARRRERRAAGRQVEAEDAVVADRAAENFGIAEEAASVSEEIAKAETAAILAVDEADSRAMKEDVSNTKNDDEINNEESSDITEIVMKEAVIDT